MNLSREVKTYALAGFPGRSADPVSTRGNLDLTPQLFRLMRQYRRDLECRANLTSGQRYALAQVLQHYDYHWLLDSFNGRRIAELQRVIAQQRGNAASLSRRVMRRNRSKIMAELRQRLLAGDGPEQVEARAALINQACSDYRTGACRSHDHNTAASYAAQNQSGTDINNNLLQAMAGKSNPPSSGLPPGSIRVLLTKPQVRTRDDLDAIIANLEKPKMLTGAPTLDTIDALYAQLFEESPWHQPVIEWMWRAHREMLHEPQAYFRLPPVLLIGPPGCGKTHLLERLANLSGVTQRRIDMAALSSSFAITGLENGWG